MVFQKPSDPFIPHGSFYSRNVIVAHLRIIKLLKMFVTGFLQDQSQPHSSYRFCISYRSTNKSVRRFHPSSGFLPYALESTKDIELVLIRPLDTMNTERVRSL